MYDLQKASVTKRIAAWIFDIMMILVVFSFAAAAIAWATGLNKHATEFTNVQNEYIANYGIDPSIPEKDLTDEQKAQFVEAEAAFQKDERAIRAFAMMLNLSFVVLGVGMFVAFFILEFLIPLFLRNGQTLGKKMFGIGVMQDNGVKLKSVSLFVRSILGKYAVETMIPVSIFLMVFMGQADMFSLCIVLVLLILEIVFIVRTNTNSALHDVLSSSVTVDIASQKIFETDEEMLEYKKKVAEEKANKAEYF